MRHSPQLIQQIIQMRVDGFTLGEIVSETGLSKTTIFHHIKSVPMSDVLIQKIKAISLSNQKIVADRRRGKSIKSYKFFKPNIWNPDFVRLIAHFLFDGSILRSSCVYYSRSKVLRDKVVKIMNKEMGVWDYKTYNSTGGVKRICYFNVELAYFIKTKADELFKYIVNAPKEQKASFLKAFFDDEGCITPAPCWQWPY